VLREIQPTLSPGDKGPDIANLKAALLFLHFQGQFLSSDPPEPYNPPPAQGPTLQPTPAELQKLAEALRLSFQWAPPRPLVALPRPIEQVYDEATQALVAFFQAQDNLTSDAVGVVADATAQQLNERLRQRGAFDQNRRRLEGLVRQRANGAPLADALVRALLLSGNVRLVLGEARTTADGTYGIDLDAAILSATVQAGEPIPLLVQALDSTGRVIAEAERSIPADEGLIRLDLVVPPPAGPGDDGDGDRFLVQGTVRFANGTPVGGAFVKAYDVDLRSLSPLGDQATTNPEGAYAIPYRRAQFTRAEKGGADLLLRLFEAGSGRELLSFSASDNSGQPIATLLLPQAAEDDTPRAVWFNAPAIATVNLVLQASEPAPSEWLALTQAVMPLLGDLWPHELNATDRVFLERESQLSSEQLQAWTLAAQAAETINLLSEESLAPFADWLAPIRESAGKRPSAYLVEWIAFYGWFRENTGSDARQQLQSPSEGLIQNLLSASNRNTIPDLQTKGTGDRPLLEVIREALDRHRLVMALEPAPEGQPASIGDLLTTLPPELSLDPDKQLAVASVVLNDQSQEVSIGNKLRKAGLEERQAWAVERTLGLQTITNGNLSLIRDLQVKEPTDKSAVLRDLVQYDVEEWQQKVKANGYPGSTEGADEAEKIFNYADQLAATVERLHPSDWIAHRIANRRFSVADSAKEGVQSFLELNPEFQIGNTPAFSYFSKLDDQPERSVRDEVLKLERIVNCSPRLALADKVLSAGYESAYAIVRDSKDAFIERVMPGGSQGSAGMDEQAALVYDRAMEASARALAIATEYIRAVQGSPLAIMETRSESSASTGSPGSPAVVASPATAAIAQTADVSTLFGNLDFCECENCTSVYSPAAYFVELLQILDGGRRNANQQTPLDILLERRPDLAHVDLTCDNTDVALPYIDLLLERLENSAAPAANSFAIENSPPGVGLIGASDLASQLNNQVVPLRLKEAIAAKGFGVDSDIRVTVQQPGSQWTLRQQGLKILITKGQIITSLTVVLYPQTSGSTRELNAVPQHVFLEPYSNQLKMQSHPWRLPFDLWREETTTWLDQLKVDRHQLMAAFKGEAQYADFDTAIEFLNFSRAEAEKLTAPVTPAWSIWGFASESITSPIKDPIGGEMFSPTAPTWIGALRERASLLRHRAGLSQRELMNLLETRFIQAAASSPNKIQLSGDECDASKMSVLNLNEDAVLRMHLFTRLWRKLAWTMPDLDRAISAFPNPLMLSPAQAAISGSGFRREFLIFIANIERLHRQANIQLEILLNWYVARLSTQQYADFSKAGSRILPSTYESLFYDRSVSRPKDPAFGLNPNRDGLVVTSESIRSKISVITAALATKSDQIEPLLPPVQSSLSLGEYTSPTAGTSVDRNGATFTILEFDLRSVQGTNVNATVKLQHSDTPTLGIPNPQFVDIPEADLTNLFQAGQLSQPATITGATEPRLSRVQYNGAKPLLRVIITQMTGTDPKITMAGRVVLAPRVSIIPGVSGIRDNLNLDNLGALSRYTALAKVLKLSIQELLLAIDLTGINPFSSPERTLKLMDDLQLIRSSGLSITELDYLLRHRSLDQSKLVFNVPQATSLLREIRQGLQQIQQDTALQIDEKGDITRKWLAYLQWPSALIEEVLGKDYLGRDRIETSYDANHLPIGITLPASMQYARLNRKLSISGSDRNALIADLDSLHQSASNHPALVTAVKRLKDAIQPLRGPSIQAETLYEGFSFPQQVSIPNFLEYNQQSKRLILLRKVSDADLTALKRTTNPLTPQDFNTAIDTLVEQVTEAMVAVVGTRKRMDSFQLLTSTQAVPFGQMPSAIPQIWASRFYFQPTSSTSGSLCFVGVMNDSEKASLLTLVPSANPSFSAYSAAINQLFNNSNRLSVQAVSFGQIPVAIPQAWAGRLYFQPTSAAAGSLYFVGVMSDSDKTSLLTLVPSANPNSSTYTAAINQLQINSRASIPFTSAFIDPTTAEQLLFDSRISQERFTKVLERLLPQVRSRLQVEFLADKISVAYAMEPAIARRLLQELRFPLNNQQEPLYKPFLAPIFSTSDGLSLITREGFAPQYDAMELLYKCGVLINSLGFDGNHVRDLLGNLWQDVPSLSLLPLNPAAPSISFSQWANLAILSELPLHLPGGEATLQVISGQLKQAPTWDRFQNTLADFLNWPSADLKILLGANGLQFDRIDDFKQPLQIKQFADCLALVLKLGTSAESTLAWLKSTLTSNDALAARQLVRSRYDQTTWYELAQPIQNKLRQERRAALLDYLIAKEGVRDSNDLFGKYLIDPEMGDCMMTTRILQATASVQLFIHRCFMGLEKKTEERNNQKVEIGVLPNSIDQSKWQWMKNYRAWEANRKVFFYPENWIEPELRDDKTPFFVELESELLQGDLTSKKAEKALQNYLSKLDEVSRLEVVGMYRDTPISSNGKSKYGYETLYVFGRTGTDPRKIFWRSYNKLDFAPPDGYWSPWQSVDLDIEESNLLYPVVWHGKVYLFWLTFQEKAEEKIGSPVVPDRYWQVNINWSHYENGKWQARMIHTIDTGKEMRIQNARKSNLFLIGRSDASEIINALFLAEQSTISNSWRTYTEYQVKFNGYSLGNAKDYTAYSYRLGPVVPDWNGRSSIEMLGSRIPFNIVSGRSAVRLIYNHQDIEVNVYDQFDFRAPLPPSLSGYSFNNVGSPAQFIFSNSQNHSFFGNPYWQFPGLGGLPFWPSIQFSTLFHPQTQRFQQVLRESGTDLLLALETQFDLQALSRLNALPLNLFTLYPNVWKNIPKLDVDFSPNGAYSQYNWELFFHLPFTVATHLAKNQRFEEARQWFHYIFNPTDDSILPEPQRFWRFRPFHEQARTTPIQRLAQILSARESSLSPEEKEEKQTFNNQITQWIANPFKPHAVARWRNRAYMFSVVMKYLDNLIAWGDQLFRRDTRESLNEALQIYVLAAQILGRKPESIPRRTRPQTRSYAELKGSLDRLSNVQVAAENVLPSSNSPSQTNIPANLPTLLFCVPENPNVMEYYNTVADRLFKLRNCMNIDGVVRQLPLFDPPIDPAILVKAAAAGIDLSTALSDLNSPLPLYRFNIHAQKASELCSEVKSLGSMLLSTLEKRDGEAMALLRSKHEISLLKAQRQIKELQVEEAKANIEAFGQSLQAAQTRLSYYLGLVSAAEELAIPTGPLAPQSARLISAALETLGKTTSILQAVTAGTSPAVAAGLELYKQILSRAADALAPSLTPPNGETNKVPMNPAEKKHLDELKISHDLQKQGKDYQAVAQFLAKIPDITLGTQGVASPVVVAQLGGSLLSTVALSQAADFDYQASEHTYRANLHSILAGYQRRAAEWLHQANLALIDMEQISKQSIAAAIKLKVSSEDLRVHDLQTQNSGEMEEYMKDKYTNQELYEWMVGQVSGTYYQSYQLAFDIAKRAEKAYRFELGLTDSETNFIQFGYWDSLKKGLLAGERLHHDIKRMEFAYLERNSRELEITKHISLLHLDPLALIQLRSTGSCEIVIPERLFDLDFPGHYFRRIKTVSLSIPCVVGPYTSINATLTLLSSQLRDSSQVKGGGYDNPDNFRASYLPIQSIATSSAQNDSGLFELNFRDERYLPFEGAGAISTWRLSLPSDFRQFDYDTISDVVLHLRYTARDAGTVLKSAALSHLKESPAPSDPPPLFLVIQPRQEFPSEWQRFLTPIPAGSSHTLSLSLTSDLFPLRDAKRSLKLTSLWLFTRCVNQDDYSVDFNDDFSSGTPSLKASPSFRGFHFAQQDLDLPLKSDAPLPLEITITRQGGNVGKEVSDLMLIFGYEWGK
jgi:hypothetical protein